MLKGKWWAWVLLVLALLISAGAIAWSQQQRPATQEALTALQSADKVTVNADRWLVFEPAGVEPRTGLIFYPGGFVDPRAYAPAARAMAAAGHRVVIVPMPANLAVLGANRARTVRDAFPKVEHWAIGGHSLGGTMAARYAARSPDDVQGLVLWASYPAASDDLSARTLPVASIYGTRDGLSSVDEVDAARPLLPPDTRYTRIEGGNHAQFGWYGPQPGDREAALSHEEQQAQIVAATLEMLDRMVDE